jgi:hypothetical protein
MPATPDDLGRIEKLFIDRDGMPEAEARDRLGRFRLALVCGPEAFSSSTLQAAILTAVNVACRCFPAAGVVTVHLFEGDADGALRLPWPAPSSLAQAIRDIAPRAVLGPAAVPHDIRAILVFGSRPDCSRGLQVTFDGWSAAVAPVGEAPRLGERDRCVIAGVLAGGLAVSEVFLDFAGVTLKAARRRVGLSLWRPDLPFDNEAALGIETPVQFLPNEAWSLGLGHLGQAYLWALSLLPYRDPDQLQIVLQDFDRVVRANLGTGVLSAPSDLGRLKTRVALAWLEARGFRPTLVERRFDADTHVYSDEPKLALSGFDGGGPRAVFDGAGFERVIDSGLGGTAANFDAIDLHTLPHPTRRSAEIWPEVSLEEKAKRLEQVERLARENPVYQAHAREFGCGQVELAGRSVAVPFVGAVAASLVLAEALRMLHDGERFASIFLRLDDPARIKAYAVPGGYRGRAMPSLKYQNAGD